MRTKEEPYDDGYAQYFEQGGVTHRVYTSVPWDELSPCMRNFFVERAEDYYRVRHHTDLGKVEL